MTSEEDPGSSVAAESVSKMDSIQSASANDSLSSHRVFKKSSPNNKLTLYLSSRDLVVSQGRIDRLQGVLLVDPEFLENKKVYGQVTLTFRYGREDEEVMGLKFCNEAIMCLAQLYPPPEPSDEYIPEPNTPLQEALIKRLGPNAYPFNMEITPLAPPSVQLVPAKEYNGAPIGTSYDIRAYVADRADEKLHRRTTVRMGIRVVQRAYAPPSPYLYVPGGGGKTGKEKAKQNKKALLFGCKSSPLESQFPRDEPFGISRSVEAVGGSHCVEDSPQHGISRSCGTVVERITREKNKPKDNSANPTITIDEAADTKNVSFKNGDIEDSASTSDVPERQMATLALENDTKYSDSDNEESESKFSSLDRHRYLCGGKRPSLAAYLSEIPAPTATVEKPFLLSDGKVCLTASLDKAIYSHGEEIQINVKIQNNSNKTVRRIKVFVVQHVDVCMFSNGKFKNVVAVWNAKDNFPVQSGGKFDKTFTLLPVKSSTKNWIALEDSYTKSGTSLASTVTTTAHNPDDRNVFAIYVSYYVKVKLLVSVMGGELSLKLPFTLMHTCSEFEHSEPIMRLERPNSIRLEGGATDRRTPSPKQDKDGT